MKNIFGFLFTLTGLVLIGIGTYFGFEKFNKEFFSENNDSLYNGVYFASSDVISVEEENDNSIIVQINQETYKFLYDGEFFINQESGLYINFQDKKLILYKDGEKIKTLYKKYKNSIHN